MLVEQIMNRKAVTVSPNTTVKDAFELVKKSRVHHLPVIDHNHLVGIVTARHLRQQCTSAGEENVEMNQKLVSSLMKTKVITAHPLDFIEDIALIMYQDHIGCLPIVQQNQFVGLVTERDIMRTLIEMTGIAHPSSQIEIEIEDRVGNLADIVQVLKDHQLNISSAVIYPSKNVGKKILVFRVETIDPRQIVKKIKDAGHHIIWPQIPEELE